jgi:NAD(P)-dependent dehydrogenase (short-subunit alcohol dehydrogenase family)
VPKNNGISKSKMKVLFLGATGIIGRQVVPILQEIHELRLAAHGGGEVNGLSVADIDITDLHQVESLVTAGIAAGEPYDAIVNCAVAPYMNVDYSSESARHTYYTNCIQVNALGAYHVYEAASRALVPRVVYISSMTAFLGPPSPDHYDAATPDQPNNVYAATKIFGEHVGRCYAYPLPGQGAPVRALCLRVGQPYESLTHWDDSWPTSSGQRSTMSDCRDIAQAIDCALKVDIKYGVYTIVSDSDSPSVNSELYDELGYKPAWKFTEDGLFPVESSKSPSEVMS